jgi:hypothetical protein
MSKLPVWFLDIDGVINVLPSNRNNIKQPHHRIWDTWENISIEGFPIIYSPELIEGINQLSDIVNIVWLTTWRNKAVSLFAPAVGLKNFPVRDSFGSHIVRSGFLRTTQERWWKLNAVTEDIDTHARPIVWTDDLITTKNIGNFVKKYALTKNVPIKTITPFGSLGLEPYHLKNIRSFVTDHYK